MSSSGFRLWQARLAEGRVTHAQASQFAKAIWARAYGVPVGGRRTNIDAVEADWLCDRLTEHPPAVVGGSNSFGHGVIDIDTGRWRMFTDAERGRLWLKANQHRLGLPALPWDSIAAFTFVDVHAYTDRWGGLCPQPVYEAHWPSDMRVGTFRYAPTPWQAQLSQFMFEFHPQQEGVVHDG